MKKIFKRGMSGLLAVLMALTVLAGFGTTTAFAASETAESYMISFPRDGDAAQIYSEDAWGHSAKNYMNGWATGSSNYTMDKKKAICEYLRKNHIGKENAIHSKELEKLFLLDGRNIRRKISALRQDGFPICSDETGYYYADNQKEINTTVCRLNELVTKVSNARTGLLFASILGENAQTVEVTIKVR